MEYFLLSTSAAVLLVGCVTAHSPEPMAANAPDIPLWQAARIGNIEAVKQHLATGAHVGAKNSYGLTLLHRSAMMKGPKEVAQLLISAGSDTNTKDKYGRTPLHYSAGEGHKEFVELLITKGADVNAKEGDDQTPLDWAIQFKEYEIADLLANTAARRVKN